MRILVLAFGVGLAGCASGTVRVLAAEAFLPGIIVAYACCRAEGKMAAVLDHSPESKP
jgi:hypothetical protein